MPGVFALFTSISCGHVGGASVSYVSGLLKPSVICVELGPTSENFFPTVTDARCPALIVTGQTHTKRD